MAGAVVSLGEITVAEGVAPPNYQKTSYVVQSAEDNGDQAEELGLNTYINFLIIAGVITMMIVIIRAVVKTIRARI